MAENTTNSATVDATETSFAIVERLATENAIGVSALADELELSKSTVHNHLQTLRNLGYVIKEDGEYRLGLHFLKLGDRARQRYDLYHAAKPEVDDLVESVGERAQVMVEENDIGIYIYQSLADQAVRTDSHIGTVTHLHTTAVGKAYLAHLPESKLESTLDRLELDELTPNTITDREVLREELDEITQQGFAFNDEERIQGMRAIGAPILSGNDRVIGSISVSGPTTRMEGTWYHEEVPERVARAARVIGIRACY